MVAFLGWLAVFDKDSSALIACITSNITVSLGSATPHFGKEKVVGSNEGQALGTRHGTWSPHAGRQPCPPAWRRHCCGHHKGRPALRSLQHHTMLAL